MRMVVLALALGLAVALVMALQRLWQRRAREGGPPPLLQALDPRALLERLDQQRPPLTVEQVQHRVVDGVFESAERTLTGRILPDTVVVSVDPETAGRIAPHWVRVHAELVTSLRELAEAEGYAWPGTRFELAADPRLGRRAVRLDLRYADRTVGLADAGSPPLRRGRRSKERVRRDDEPVRPEDGARSDGEPTWQPTGAGGQPAWFLLRADGLSYRLPIDGSVTVGAARTCDVVLGSAAVSRVHARLTARASDLLVEDLGSTNGTFVDGARVRGRQRVRRDTALRLGPEDTVRLVYRVESGVTR